MKKVNSILILTLGYLALIQTNIAEAIDVKSGSSATSLSGTWTDVVATIENIVAFIVGLLYLVAVIFALYGGFQILTAGGDEEKVKSGKTTLINAAIGLIVIFLASTLINWIISLFGSGGGIVA